MFNHAGAIKKILGVSCLFIILGPASPALSQLATIDNILLSRTTVAPGCPLDIDVQLHNCKVGGDMALIMAISSHCGFTSIVGGPSNGGMGNDNGGYLQGWDKNNFQDIIVFGGPGMTPYINQRYRSGVEYWFNPATYQCAGAIANSTFKGLNLCTSQMTAQETCVDGFLLSNTAYHTNNGPVCSSSPVGVISYNIPPEMTAGTYYVNVGVSTHDTATLNCWENGRFDNGTTMCMAFTVAGSCATGGSTTPTPVVSVVSTNTRIPTAVVSPVFSPTPTLTRTLTQPPTPIVSIIPTMTTTPFVTTIFTPASTNTSTSVPVSSTPTSTRTITTTSTTIAVSTVTQTPTFTRTNTPFTLSTPTSLVTVVLSPTPTHTPLPGLTPVPYPNPCTGQPVHIRCGGLGSNRGIRLSLLAAHGRRICGGRYQADGAGNVDIVWDLRDHRGEAVSNGLYYACIERDEDSKKYLCKILLMR